MPSSPLPSPWLFSRRADVLLFGGPALVSLLFLAGGARLGLLDGDLPVPLWLLLVVGVDVAHVWSTGWRVYADTEELRRRPALTLGLPAAAYAAGVVLFTAGDLVFWRVLAYLATFHFVRQQYGWVALYRRKSGENAEEGAAWERRLDAAVVYGATLAPLVWWHARLPRRFHWLIAGDYAAGLPAWAGPAALAAFETVFALWVGKEARRLATGRPVSWGKVLVVVTTALVWHLGIVVFDSDYAFAVTNVLVHGVPYFGLVLQSVRSSAAARAAAGRKPVLADLGARHAALFMAPLLLLAFLEEWGWDLLVWHENGALFPGGAIDPGPLLLSLLVPLLALPQATHYLLDAWIWKVKPENRAAAQAVGLAAPADADAR
ncbi:MAG TPA: hypothetical protein PLP50_08560 [Thermoanaerobaculia bacterium]|nr:hypothetical protein [Thermoanaerobaculia bacterium]HQN09028.1 hypothetical protein [Thermoanaerobaculia bacterium]HQP85364.1 hypothetical protein [Thermoanaerobaculia bacterium]